MHPLMKTLHPFMTMYHDIRGQINDATVKELGLTHFHWEWCPCCEDYTIGCDCCGQGLTLREKLGFCCYETQESFEAARRDARDRQYQEFLEETGWDLP